MVIIHKESGLYKVLEMEELSPDFMIAFDPIVSEISGIILVQDIEDIAGEMEDNTTAVLMQIENLWTNKFGETAVRSSGHLMLFDRIPFEVTNEPWRFLPRLKHTRRLIYDSQLMIRRVICQEQEER